MVSSIICVLILNTELLLSASVIIQKYNQISHFTCEFLRVVLMLVTAVMFCMHRVITDRCTAVNESKFITCVKTIGAFYYDLILPVLMQVEVKVNCNHTVLPSSLLLLAPSSDTTELVSFSVNTIQLETISREALSWKSR